MFQVLDKLSLISFNAVMVEKIDETRLGRLARLASGQLTRKELLVAGLVAFLDACNRQPSTPPATKASPPQPAGGVPITRLPLNDIPASSCAGVSGWRQQIGVQDDENGSLPCPRTGTPSTSAGHAGCAGWTTRQFSFTWRPVSSSTGPSPGGGQGVCLTVSALYSFGVNQKSFALDWHPDPSTVPNTCQAEIDRWQRDIADHEGEHVQIGENTAKNHSVGLVTRTACNKSGSLRALNMQIDDMFNDVGRAESTKMDAAAATDDAVVDAGPTIRDPDCKLCRVCVPPQP
jgi:hypothetical protein